MRQPHPELNFRRGKGRRKELKQSLSGSALIDAMRFVGMTDEQIKEKLLEMQRGAEGEG